MIYFPLPNVGTRAVWNRHFMVWRKTAGASLIGNFGDPLLYLIGMGYGLGRFVGDMDTMPYLVYVGAGILAASSMNTATFETLYGAFTRMTRQNTYHAMLATPLTVADVVGGEVMWAATKSLFAGVAIFLVGTLLGAFPAQTAILALPVVFLSGLVFGSLGMMVTAISPSYEFFLYYFTLVTTPMFLFCGVFYPADTLPAILTAITTILPLTHIIDIIRALTAGTPVIDLMWHLSVIVGMIVVAFSAAVRLVTRRMLA